MSILLLFGELLTKILSNYWKEVILKVNIFLFIAESKTWTLRITQEHSRALKSAQKRSWPLISTYELSLALMSTHEHYEL